jgi:predicted nucleic acid-binding protein
LRDTFRELIVTNEVAQEFGSELPDWVAIRPITKKSQYVELSKNLGKGEASSITLALEFADSLLIVDERKGRKVALEMEIEIIGSLGVLIKAKETGVIPSVKNILNEIDKTNFRISGQIKEKVLKKAGEL